MTTNDAVSKYEAVIRKRAKEYASRNFRLDEWELISVGYKVLWELAEKKPGFLESPCFVVKCIKRRMISYMKSIKYRGRENFIPCNETVENAYCNPVVGFEEIIEGYNETQKTLLRLTFIDGYSQPEIARTIGRSQSYVSNRIFEMVGKKLRRASSIRSQECDM